MKIIKKSILTLIISLLVVVIAIPKCNFAANENLKITVTGEVGGRILSIYKLFDLKYNGENYYYSWDNLITESFFKEKKYETEIQATEYLKSLQNNSTELTDLAEEYYSYCKQQGDVGRVDRKSAIITESKIEFSGLNKGYYLVYDETNSDINTAKSAAILSSLTENTEIDLKIDCINVEKESNKTSAFVKENIKFTVTTTVPEMIGYKNYEFNIKDTLSRGLSLNLTENGKPNVTIKIDGKEYTDFNATYSKNEDGTSYLNINFLNFIKQKINSGKKIELEYYALLNDKAIIENDNSNSVKIEYSNNPITSSKGETNTDVVHIYTYTINFTKKSSKGEVLNGAKFILQLENGKYAVLENGIYAGSTEDINKATEINSDNEGKFTVSGVKEGKYKLIEKEAPKGYNKPDFTFDFNIIQELNEDGTLKIAKFDYISDENNKSAKGYLQDMNNNFATFSVEILNTKAGLLPSTGGKGTIVCSIIGGSTISIAGILLIIKRKHCIN